MLIAPIIKPGVVLSQPPIRTAPSSGWLRSNSSVSMARKLRYIIADGLTKVSDSEIAGDRKSTRLNSSHTVISYAVFCLKKQRAIRLGRSRKSGADYGLGAVTAQSLGRKRSKPKLSCFFFNITAHTETYTLSLHDALPI